MADVIYLHFLLDHSASMTGAPLEALKQGFQLAHSTFSAHLRHTLIASVISFESRPHLISRPTEISKIDGLGVLEPGGTSCLGRALRLLEEIMPPKRPSVVYLFSDGEPTDDWQVIYQNLRPRLDKLIGIACGLYPHEAWFEQHVDQSFEVSNLTPDMYLRTLRGFEG
ncbi:MAG: VWA domain-containing protein [Anaerolinea sp.]|nr:VWA domain-containing protein [Anaerolinea sp.]MCC6976577.1 VWA domain-containing protein [Anaerolineae bacterium]CAG0969815.1 hypothetical protein ANRL4_01180 [Anaerolineae bacterium]